MLNELPEKYRLWIVKNWPDTPKKQLQSEKATLKMAQEFPELKRVRGIITVEDDVNSMRAHWWLIDEGNKVIDPTAHHFQMKIKGYTFIDDRSGPPTGVCPNCGGDSYNNRYLCCFECEREFVEFLESNH